jgi:hypothetical protein
MTTLLDQGRRGKWATLRAVIIRRDNHRCTRCGNPDDLQVDHIRERQHGGTDDPNNLTTLCKQCHQAKSRHANKKSKEKSNRKAEKEKESEKEKHDTPFYGSRQDPTPACPPFVSEWDGIADIATPFTEVLRERDRELEGLPLRFPAPHAEAVSSLGDAAAAWMEARLRADPRTRVRGLRWWQWLVLQRLLERRADGSWCWPVGFVSVGRQLGKSELLCELAAWRGGNAGLFDGLPQEVGHCANTVNIARKVQSTRWRWAEAAGLPVARQLGDSRVTWPDESAWITMASENTYSRSLSLVLADEAWSWHAEEFWQSTFPTLVERELSMAVLFSTAHDTPRSLVGTLLADGSVASLLWAPPRGADLSDEGVWRSSSPFWSQARLRAMRMASSKPSFVSQWLNVWPESTFAVEEGGWLDEGLWLAARGVLRVPRRVLVAAVEDARGGVGGAVALAWLGADGRVCVTARSVGSLTEAWRVAGCADRVVCGYSLVREPGARRVSASPVGVPQTSDALKGLRAVLSEGGVVWDGDELAGQMGSVVVREEPSGLRVSSGAPSALVRCAAWAVSVLRTRGEPVLV